MPTLSCQSSPKQEVCSRDTDAEARAEKDGHEPQEFPQLGPGPDNGSSLSSRPKSKTRMGQ